MFSLRFARPLRPALPLFPICRARVPLRLAPRLQPSICIVNLDSRKHISLQSLFQRSSHTPSPRTVAEISKLEAIADSDPSNVASQVHLFQELLNTRSKTGRNIVMSRWERMCEFVCRSTSTCVNSSLTRVRIHPLPYFIRTKRFNSISPRLSNQTLARVFTMQHNGVKLSCSLTLSLLLQIRRQQITPNCNQGLT